MRQKFITECVRFFITKCDSFITNLDITAPKYIVSLNVIEHALYKQINSLFFIAGLSVSKYFFTECHNRIEPP